MGTVSFEAKVRGVVKCDLRKKKQHNKGLNIWPLWSIDLCLGTISISGHYNFVLFCQQIYQRCVTKDSVWILNNSFHSLGETESTKVIKIFASTNSGPRK